MTWFARAVACCVAPLLVASCSSTPDPGAVESGTDIRVGREANAHFRVTPQDIGIHSFTTQPEVPSGSLRLACFPTWSQTNPADGEYDWTGFDEILARAESWGFQDIVYVFCGTPQWAGKPADAPDQAVFGPGTAQPPADMADYTNFVRAVAERYRGRIDGYEVWNEPSSPQFFTGTPAEMGEMTELLQRTVKEVDPQAYVLSAGFQTHRPDYYDRFVPGYFADLRTRNWPVDGISAHFYPLAEGTPQTRSAQIERLQADLDRYGAPAELPLWDTEINYNVDVPGGAPDGRITGSKAAAWTAQSYLDGWRRGVRRTYWYLWTTDYYGFQGIQMRPGDPATLALQTLGSWVIGSEFQGCTDADNAVDCTFSKDDGTKFRVAWSDTRGDTPIRLSGDTPVCPVDGSACTTQSGELVLDELPVRIG